MTHIILSYSPFTVKFIEGENWITKTYNVVLTTAEIKAEYDYIDFDPEENIPDLEYPQ